MSVELIVSKHPTFTRRPDPSWHGEHRIHQTSYPIGAAPHEIVFGVTSVSTGPGQGPNIPDSQVEEAAKSILGFFGERGETQIWDDEWRWTSIGAPYETALVLCHEVRPPYLGEHSFEWVLISVNANNWFFRPRGGKNQQIDDSWQFKYRFRIDGTIVDYDILNPGNSPGNVPWSGDHILFGFGF